MAWVMHDHALNEPGHGRRFCIGNVCVAEVRNKIIYGKWHASLSMWDESGVFTVTELPSFKEAMKEMHRRLNGEVLTETDIKGP